MTSSAPPQLLSKEKIDKMEKRNNWTKTIEDWFQQVLYVGNMGINHSIRTTNKFLEVQKILKGMRKFCIDFPRIYESTTPKLKPYSRFLTKHGKKTLSLQRMIICWSKCGRWILTTRKRCWSKSFARWSQTLIGLRTLGPIVLNIWNWW